MADEADFEDDEDLELDDGLEPDEQDDETPENQEDDEQEETPAADDWQFEEVEDAEPAPESSVIRQMREQLREKDRLLAERAAPAVEVGPKPKIADFYTQDDPEGAFEAALEQWQERDRAAKAAQAAANQESQQLNASFAEDLANQDRQAKALKVPDYDLVSETALAKLSPLQKLGIAGAAENSARLLYALGKHPAKLDALTKIANPFKFAAAVAKAEASLKVTTRNRKPAQIDEPARGSASMAGGDKVEKRLEDEADRTGDRSKLIAYRQSKARR